MSWARDPWEDAALSLSHKDKTSIALSGPAPNLDEVLNCVDDAKREFRRKQWRIHSGANKEAIFLRDIYDKIAVWIQRFVDMVDVAVQYDPGHAALPWASIRFLLKASVNNVEKAKLVVEGVERVSNLIFWCDIQKKLHLYRSSSTATRLQLALTKLCSAMLRFLAKAIRFYKKSTAVRTLEGVTQSRDKFTQLLNDISDRRAEVLEDAAIIDSENLKCVEKGLSALTKEEKKHYKLLLDLLKELQIPIHKMEGHLRMQKEKADSEEQRNILSWLSTIPYTQHHQQTYSNVLSGTGSWFFADPQLVEWQRLSSSSIIWLHGIPGCGKSKLTSMLVDKSLRDAENTHGSNPAYFYCARSVVEPERADPDYILRCIAKQLSCLGNIQSLLPPSYEIYEQRAKSGDLSSHISLDDCTNLIIALTEYRPLTTLIIDALDECISEKVDDFLDALSRILQQSSGSVKVFVSSRNDQGLVCRLTDYPNLEIEASQNQDDISAFVRHETSRLIEKRRLLYGVVPRALKERIIHVLCEKAQGMFRWVSLQLEHLCTLKSQTWVESRLGLLPRGLEKAYDQLYRQRTESYEPEMIAVVEAVLSWLLFCQKPLLTSAFVQAVSFTLEDRPVLSTTLILDLCFNLVVVDKSLDVFRFAHLSVQEYLQSKKIYNAALAHSRLLSGCLNYLSSYTFLFVEDKRALGMAGLNAGPQTLTSSSFYMGLFWPTHFDLSNDYGHRDPVINKLLTFFRYGFATWANTARNTMCPSPSRTSDSITGLRMVLSAAEYHRYTKLSQPFVARPNPFAAVAVLGCAEILERGLSVELDALCNDSKPLAWACHHQHFNVITWMLKQGADPNEQCSEGTHGPPLVEALKNQNIALTRLLLTAGAILAPGNEYNKEIALCWADASNYLDFARSLVDHGTDVNLWDILLELPPDDAQTAGVNELLISRNAVIDLSNDRDKALVYVAVRTGHYVKAKVLIEHGACLSNPALVATALWRCDVQMLELLLRNGVKVKKWKPDHPHLRMLGKHLGSHQCRLVNQAFSRHGVDYGLPESETG